MNKLNKIKNSTSFKNLTLITISLIVLKSFNLVIPYLLNKNEYNEFNKVFYYASLISTLGTLGFTYAITQINIHPAILSVLVLINIFAGLFIMRFFFGVINTPYELLIVTLIAFTSIIFFVYNFELLFHSQILKYTLTIFIFSGMHYTAIIFFKLFAGDILLFYGIGGLLGLILSLHFFNLGGVSKTAAVQKFYKFGLSTFIINSAAGMALMADKFFANNFFSIDVANAYTFSWALVAPLFYLGNIAEKNIYAVSPSHSVKKSFYFSFFIIITGILLYGGMLYGISNFYKFLLPGSINVQLFSKIISVMIIGYAVYIILHFPINGILFKLNLHTVQKYSAILNLTAILIFVIAYFTKEIIIPKDDYIALLFLVWGFLLLITVPKILLISILEKEKFAKLFKLY